MVRTVGGWAEELEAVPGRPAQRFASAVAAHPNRSQRRADPDTAAPAFAEGEPAHVRALRASRRELLKDLLSVSGAWEGKVSLSSKVF